MFIILKHFSKMFSKSMWHSCLCIKYNFASASLETLAFSRFFKFLPRFNDTHSITSVNICQHFFWNFLKNSYIYLFLFVFQGFFTYFTFKSSTKNQVCYNLFSEFFIFFTQITHHNTNIILNQYIVIMYFIYYIYRLYFYY